MSDTAQFAVFGVVAPLVLALAFLWPGRRAEPGADGRTRHGWRIPLALAVPVALAFFALNGWPSEQWQHLAFVPVAGAVVGVAMALTKRTMPLRLAALVVLGLLCTACVWPIVQRDALPIKLVPGVGTVVLAGILEGLAQRRPGPVTALAWSLAVATSAAIVLLSGSMTMSVPYGALAVALAATGLVALIGKRAISLADGAVAVIAPLLVVVPLTAWLYASSYDDSMPRASFALPTIAAAALWLGEIRRRGGWIDVVVRFLAVAIPCAAAVYLATAGASVEEEADPYTDMYRDMLGQ